MECTFLAPMLPLSPAAAASAGFAARSFSAAGTASLKLNPWQRQDVRGISRSGVVCASPGSMRADLLKTFDSLSSRGWQTRLPLLTLSSSRSTTTSCFVSRTSSRSRRFRSWVLQHRTVTYRQRGVPALRCSLSDGRDDNGSGSDSSNEESVGCSEGRRDHPEGESTFSRNEVEGGRSSEWMGDTREVEIASRLVAKWKRERGQEMQGSSPPLPPQEVLLKAVSDLSRLEGRSARTTNVVMGGTAATPYGDDWLELDKKVNKYPSFRGFTAIGTGGDDFVDAMVDAVESVLETQIPKWQVSARESAGGRYVSVKIGPVRMESSDQVRAVYEAMRKDQRMRYFL